MFKTLLAATAVALIAVTAHAAPTPLDRALSTPAAGPATQYEEVAYYCEWVTVYDGWGNWVTVWQCY